MFIGCSALTSVVIPDGVTRIGFAAFKGCTSLTDITVPDSVRDIQYWAFTETAWFDAQPDGDVYLGRVYYWYKGTMPENTSIVIKDGTKNIAGNALNFKDQLTSVTIPDSMEVISERAFYGCTGLTSIVIPEGVTEIQRNAFWNCTALKDITLPDSLDTVGSMAFFNTAWLNEHPDGDVYAGPVYYVYKGFAPENTSIVIKDGTKAIAEYAFDYPYGYDGPEIPHGVTSITIPESVVSIGKDAYSNCPKLTQINWNAVNVITDSIPGGGIMGKDADGIHVIFGDKVESIPALAFSGEDYVKKVTFGENIKTIGNYAFQACKNITAINMPDSVTEIGVRAFYSCENLVELKLSNNLQYIPDEAFRFCRNLKQIRIPLSVTAIGTHAFTSCNAPLEVYYDGSQSQWNEIDIAPFNYDLTTADIHFAVAEPEPEETPKSFIEKITEFFRKIVDWFKNLFGIFNA